jgi:ribosomal protein L14E/L6E/L27E
MGKLLDEYQVGQVVVSKRGKDAGREYVIVGFLVDEKRLALADAERFNIDRPKPKNPKHVMPTSRVAVEVAAWIGAGKNMNRGELRRFLESARERKPEWRGRAANDE